MVGFYNRDEAFTARFELNFSMYATLLLAFKGLRLYNSNAFFFSVFNRHAHGEIFYNKDCITHTIQSYVALALYMFRTASLSISRSLALYTQQ